MNEAYEFRDNLLTEARKQFLKWAVWQSELRKEYVAFIAEANAQCAENDSSISFDDWLTDWYWGHID